MTATAGAVVEPVVRSAVPVLEPVSRAAEALLSPLTKTAAPLVAPIVSAVTSPVSGLLGALSSAVKPVSGPVLGGASPILTHVLTPVAGGAGRPVVARVAGSAVRAVLPLARAVTTPPPNQQVVPTVVGRPAAAVAPAKPVGPGCAATAAGAHRGKAQRQEARLGSHQPGETPAQPGAPVPASSSDVASGGGSSIPPAFLTAGHAPHHFRASPWTHGDFVPLWRPSEPGTGPG
ncbi:hypothetical protein RAM_26265 [Amycolatopsis mediterranei S699]|uniref:Uncharacterized protein n=1 Tax=Amycolatopsis mediterranei (strain S699) TaxID=713604 RepID=A0A9R0NZY5_AMYMS|nr:hypothetical protein RAM_26265 [Amycolatopsis mediterranei S699]